MIYFQPARAVPRLQRRFRPAVESLEGRLVLSLCGVTCELVDGVLNVHGTPADDFIALRYDSATASVQVIGGADELVGVFAVSDLQALHVHGGEGNDRFEVDSALPVAVKVNGVAADKVLAARAAPGGHVHSFAASLGLTTSRQEIAETSAALLPAGGAAGVLPVEAHTSHQATSPQSIPASHVHHPGMTAASPGGSHAAAHQHWLASSRTTMAETPAASATVLQGHDDTLPVQGDGNEHGRHRNVEEKGESDGKLLPKRCTSTYAGGVLVTSVNGKRQCDCPQKQTAKEAAEKAAAQEEQSAKDALLAAAANCLPCQQTALWLGIPGAGDSCSLAPGLAGLALPAIALSDAEACPARPPKAQPEPVQSAGLTGVQMLGWTLLAASTAFMPTLWQPRKEDEREQDGFARDVDWLLGRLNFEPLVR